jgi:hypothetical protein
MPGRIGQLREVIVFQFKLVLDALRDLIISPLSLGAAALDFLLPSSDGRRWFHRVLALGRRSEELIGLWHVAGRDQAASDDIDAGLRKLEDWLRSGQAPRQAKDQLRAISERINQTLREARGQEDAGIDPEPVRPPPPDPSSPRSN